MIHPIVRIAGVVISRSLDLAIANVRKGQFREEDHPRGEDGKFGSGGRGGEGEGGKEGGDKPAGGGSPGSFEAFNALVDRLYAEKVRAGDTTAARRAMRAALREHFDSIDVPAVQPHPDLEGIEVPGLELKPIGGGHWLGALPGEGLPVALKEEHVRERYFGGHIPGHDSERDRKDHEEWRQVVDGELAEVADEGGPKALRAALKGYGGARAVWLALPAPVEESRTLPRRFKRVGREAALIYDEGEGKFLVGRAPKKAEKSLRARPRKAP